MTPPGDGSDEERAPSPADRAFLEYVRLRERGEPVDVERFLAGHPDCAVELREVIATFAEFEGERPPAGAPPIPESDPRLGKPLQGRYRVERFLARGGMGRVYLATDLRTNSAVVVKLLAASDDPRVDDPRVDDRLRREAHVVGALSSRQRGTARIIDFSALDDGTPYLVMEYVAGPSLRERLAEGPLSPEEGLRILARLCETLEAVHASGVAHGDLKPSNVVLRRASVDDRTVEPVLIDFGVARVRGPLQVDPNTASGQFRGTLRYAAPESLDGKIDALSDQFSLGVMAYEMMTGRHPFDVEGLGALVESIRSVEPPAADTVAAHLPRRIAAAIRRAMAKRREARFASVADFAAALDRDPATGWRRRAFRVGLVAAALLPVAWLVYQAGVRRPAQQPTPAKIEAAARVPEAIAAPAPSVQPVVAPTAAPSVPARRLDARAKHPSGARPASRKVAAALDRSLERAPLAIPVAVSPAIPVAAPPDPAARDPIAPPPVAAPRKSSSHGPRGEGAPF